MLSYVSRRAHMPTRTHTQDIPMKFNATINKSPQCSHMQINIITTTMKPYEDDFIVIWPRWVKFNSAPVLYLGKKLNQSEGVKQHHWENCLWSSMRRAGQGWSDMIDFSDLWDLRRSDPRHECEPFDWISPPSGGRVGVKSQSYSESRSEWRRG